MEQPNEPLITYFPVREVNEYSAVEKGPGILKFLIHEVKNTLLL